jgi:hypothetical protein
LSLAFASATVCHCRAGADDYRRDHPETGPFHYIDIPLADSKIDMARECPDGQCVIAQTERFLSVVRDPEADWNSKAEALKFVVHFVANLHQPLHDEDDGDKGGNTWQSSSRVTPTTCIVCRTRGCWSTSTPTLTRRRRSLSGAGVPAMASCSFSESLPFMATNVLGRRRPTGEGSGLML